MAEFDELELPDDALYGALVIEWGGTVAESVGDDHMSITIDILDEDSRTFDFRPSGSWSERGLGMLT